MPPEAEAPAADRAPGSAPDAAPAAPDVSREAGERPESFRLLASTIGAPGVSPEAALNLVETYDPAAVDAGLREELGMIVEDYGLSLDDLSADEQERFAALWLGAKRGRTDGAKRDTAEAFDFLAGERLMRFSMDKIDRLTADVRGAETAADVKDRLKDVMAALARTAKNVPMDEDHEEEWEDIDRKFRELLSLKSGTEGEVRDAFSDVFEEHADFIEDQLVTARMGKSRGDVQQVA